MALVLTEFDEFLFDYFLFIAAYTGKILTRVKPVFTGIPAIPPPERDRCFLSTRKRSEKQFERPEREKFISGVTQISLSARELGINPF